MRLALFSLMFASLVAAAPVPKADAPAFGASGIVTTDELKSVSFKSRVVKSAEELKSIQFKRGRHPDDYDVAVHLPKARFQRGEPIPAYFIVRNKTARAIDLNARLDFRRGTPHLEGECSLAIRRRGDVKQPSIDVLHSLRSSESALAVIPANGFFVAKADLSQFTAEPLPAGEYEVEWMCQLRCSAAVAFTVLPREASVEPAKHPEPHIRFLAIEPDDPEAGDDDAFRWRDFDLVPVEAARMSAALACGPFGKHVPDLRTIPAADGRIEVRASLRREDKIEKLIVSLTSTTPGREVSFEDVPWMYLQVEERAGAEPRKRIERSLRDELKRAEQPRFKTPLIFEMPIDAEQWTKAGFGTGRVAVLVTSGKLEFPSRGDRAEAKLQIQSFIRPRAGESWSGLVRSAFIPLNGK